MSVTSMHASAAASFFLLALTSGVRAQEASPTDAPAEAARAAGEAPKAGTSERTEPSVETGLADEADPEVLLPEPAGEDGARARVTLREAVEQAMHHSADMERADAAVHEAEAVRKQARGRYGPTLSVDGNVRVWNEEAQITFEVPGMMPMPGMEQPPVTLRGQVTSDLNVTVAQPLTGLWRIHESHQARSRQLAASRADRKATGHDVALQVSQAYFDALKSEKLAEIAQVTVEQLEAHLARARAFHEMGLISRNEVLETQVRLAEAKADFIQARGNVTLSRSRLAYEIGLPSDQPIAPAPVDEEREVAPPPEGYEASAERATARRADLESTRHRIEATEANVSAAKAAMLPELAAVGSYQHVEGQALAIQDQAFIGAQLSWNLWEWGSTYYGIEQAEAQAAQARASKRRQEEGIKLEVRQAYVQLQSAREQLEVARQSVEQAEENLRVVQHRFEANAATSTEVLDAQALLAQARVRKTTAYYDYRSAEAALQRAVGERPVPDVVVDGAAR